MQKIWFITGISSGLGKSLAEKVMESGDFVIGTFRQAAQVEAFNQQNEGRGFALQMEVSKQEEVKNAFKVIEEKFGRLDVLVNNAGIGFLGAIEEASVAEAKDIFETNVFGALQVTQAALPIFRKQRSGHLFQISSGAGMKASAGFGIYNASKFALEGFSEALADEVKPLGITVTIVEPGPFRTQFAGTSIKQADNQIEDYAATVGVFRKRMVEVVNQNQEGDPNKAAKIMVEVARLENPPLRLPLGKIVLNAIQAKLDSVQKDLNEWKEVAASAVF
ncbi:MAG: oxidoreductase [Thermoflexibacter sp.]|nr:oxidoreductase [Thermoflexibacter sp.]